MLSLEGKIALVTGASRGIGRAAAIALGRQKAYVSINYAGNEAAASETLAKVREAGGDGELQRFDVGDAAAVDAAISDLGKRKGKLDILVVNAGIALDTLLLRVTEDQIQKTFSTNVNGALFCAKSAVRLMMKKKVGRIVLLSSVVAESGNPGQAVYSASKAALIGLTKTLAREYASRGITVNSVAPGFIDTDMTTTIQGEMKDGMLKSIPLGRTGRAAEVAAAVVFLCSDEASYVTGETLRVNGGMLM